MGRGVAERTVTRCVSDEIPSVSTTVTHGEESHIAGGEARGDEVGEERTSHVTINAW